MELNAAPAELGHAPIVTIVRNLDRMFGKGVWENYEIETISLELGYAFDDLTRDKLNFLQLLGQSPDLFFNDVMFFLHGVGVINNNVADFDTFPIPTSLEIAYAHTQVSKLYPHMSYGTGVAKTIQYVLTLEGYSEPVWPFNDMGIKSEDLAKGQEPSDTKNKADAIKKYIEAMNNELHSGNDS